jgi:ribosomal protein L21
MNLLQKPIKFAIVEFKQIPYKLSLGDVLIVNRLKLPLGQVIGFDRIFEVGGNDWRLVGNPFISHKLDFRAVVVEHQVANPITRKHWKKSGLVKSVTNQAHKTLLRITKMDWIKDP